jgi:hypothetical protein
MGDVGSKTTCLDAVRSSQKSPAPEQYDNPLRRESAQKAVAPNPIGQWKRGTVAAASPRQGGTAGTAEPGTSDNVLVAGLKDHCSHAA